MGTRELPDVLSCKVSLLIQYNGSPVMLPSFLYLLFPYITNSLFQIPWKWVISFFPVMRGRAYSISTGGEQITHRAPKGFHRLQLIVALVKYRTVLKKVRQGLCSRYIASLPPGTEMHVKFSNDDSFYEPTNDHPRYVHYDDDQSSL